MIKVIVTSIGYSNITKSIDYARDASLYLIEGSNLSVSDGYHTMDELYEHRLTLYITLCRVLKGLYPDMGVWRSMVHQDGTAFEGEFILGICKEKGKQVTYHIPHARWDETSFAETLDKAPEWDKHSSTDVLDRLKTL